ncbi:MAG: hypothetical protein KC425_07415, partial [Anaerolineales bacterium]|nr:hypothetical protein [Anaerolineales bacterium]
MTTLWLTIPLLAAAAIALGWLLQRPFAAPLDALERLFVSFALGTAVLGSLALLLAQFGRFALPTLAALAALIAAAALLTRRYSLSVIRNPLSVIRYPLSVIRNPTSVIRHPKSKIQNPKSKIRFPPSAALLLWLPFALWLFFRPHEFIVGAADAGVYTNLAAEIAQNGRIHPHDPLLANLDPALYDD